MRGCRPHGRPATAPARSPRAARSRAPRSRAARNAPLAPAPRPPAPRRARRRRSAPRRRRHAREAPRRGARPALRADGWGGFDQRDLRSRRRQRRDGQVLLRQQGRAARRAAGARARAPDRRDPPPRRPRPAARREAAPPRRGDRAQLRPLPLRQPADERAADVDGARRGRSARQHLRRPRARLVRAAAARRRARRRVAADGPDAVLLHDRRGVRVPVRAHATELVTNGVARSSAPPRARRSRAR